MLNSLERAKLGCHLLNQYIGCIVYADDILVLSASVMDLQKMLDICFADFSAIGMKFNPIKSTCMCVGPNVHIMP